MSSPWMPLNGPWQFDVLSALIGAGAGLVAGAAAAFALRRRIEGTVQSARDQAKYARERLTMGSQQRYLEWLEGRVNALHVLREGATLADLYVESEFISPPPRPSVSNKPIEPPPPTVPVSAVLKAAPRLVVTGTFGSGRTALLAHITHMLAQSMRRSQTALDLPERTLPAYVHLAELTLEPEPPPPTDPKAKLVKLDPIKPLIDTIADRMPLLIQTSAPGLLEKAIKTGEAILLLDGFDELETETQSRAVTWLKALCEASPKLRIVITAAPGGYTPLVELGFTAIALAPWTAKQVTQLAERWMRAAKGSEADALHLATMLKPTPGTSPLPLDVMLTAFIWQKRHTVPPNRAAAFAQTVDLDLEPVQAASPLSPMLARTMMGKLALTLLSEGRSAVERAEIERSVTMLLAPATLEAELPAPNAEPRATEEAPKPQEVIQTPAPVEKPKEPPKPKGVPESVEALCKCGLLIERRKDHFAFAHRRIQAYLAAWQITQEGSGTLLAQHLGDALWADVLEFCAGLVNIAPLVDVLLKWDASAEEGDLFHARLWTLANWAASARAEATWRGKVLAQVAAQLMQPHQLPVLRERATLALLATQDKGLGYVFKQAMASSDPHLRAQAVRGLGKLGREQDLPTFQAALQDSDATVREEAVRAMAGVSSQAGVEHLASVLLTAEEAERRVAALMLAECSPDGWRILREAAQEEDMLVRRAAAYGLAATHQDWARDVLLQLEHQDPQWFVRSAATEALAAMKAADEYALDCSPIVLDQQGWLVEWAAARGIPLGLGRNAEPVLMRALNEGDTPVRLAVIHTLAHIGTEEHIEMLRAQFSASEAEIRDAAYHALKAIGDRLGIKIKRG